MRLLHCTIRDYRLHRECQGDFDPYRTLIGGPNECGKSTLVEAIHRALFLKAKGNTEIHRAMQAYDGGQPEVELRFTHGSRVYHLKKRFGPNGSVSLLAEGEQTLNGDAAENELANLLTGSEPARGRQMLEQWSHLWVWQGLSGSDPTQEASRHSAALFQYLQEKGGAAAVQSGLDAELAARFRDEADRLFRQNGQPKTGTEVDAAFKQAELGAERLEKARQRLEAAEQHLREYQAASRAIENQSQALETLRQQKRETDDRICQVDLTRRQAEVEERHWKEASEKRSGFAGEHEKVLELEARLAEHQEELEPLTAQEKQLKERAADSERRAAQAAGDYAKAGQGATEARYHRDGLQAVVNRFEKQAALADLTERAQQIDRRREEAAALEDSLARLPELSEPRLRQLRTLETEKHQAQAALEAMATAIEVVESVEPVQLADAPLSPGESKIITGASELQVGHSARIQIRPGGGKSLEEARQHHDDTARILKAALAELDRSTVEEAAGLLRERQLQETQLAALRQRLKQDKSDTFTQRLEEAKAAATRADSELQRRIELVADLPDHLEAATKALHQAEDALTKATQQEGKAKAANEAESCIARSAAQDFESHRELLAGKRASASDLQARHRLLEETYGNHTARLEQLRTLTETESSTRLTLEMTRQRLESLGADQVAADAERLTRALSQMESALQDAQTRRAVAEANLRSNGIDDPHADYAAENATNTAAQERLAAEQRKAEAIRLLADLFSREQRALADQFTQPLAEAISGYLTCLFGPGARANVTVNEDEFSGLELVRPSQDGAAMAFDALSGGAKEQVAAAMRLAVAEVLAAGFDGALPVIFDDAFAYSDPERVQTLQRMLDRAAGRGLQIIILTCNPSDYAALGAHQCLLSAAE